MTTNGDLLGPLARPLRAAGLHRLNISLDKSGRERTRLRADIQSLASQVSSAQAAGRIQAQAQRDLGVVPAAASDTIFVQLSAK